MVYTHDPLKIVTMVSTAHEEPGGHLKTISNDSNLFLCYILGTEPKRLYMLDKLILSLHLSLFLPSLTPSLSLPLSLICKLPKEMSLPSLLTPSSSCHLSPFFTVDFSAKENF